MKQDEVIKNNLALHGEWMRYVFEHPEVLNQIPKGAELVIIPNNNQALARENQKIAHNLKNKGLPFVIVHLNLPKPPIPKVEVVMA